MDNIIFCFLLTLEPTLLIIKTYKSSILIASDQFSTISSVICLQIRLIRVGEMIVPKVLLWPLDIGRSKLHAYVYHVVNCFTLYVTSVTLL